MTAGALFRRFPRRFRFGTAAGRHARVPCRAVVIAAMEAPAPTWAVSA